MAAALAFPITPRMQSSQEEVLSKDSRRRNSITGADESVESFAY